MIKPEELALIKGYTVTKEGILLNRNGIQVKGRIKDRKRDYYNFDIRIGPRKENKKVHCMIHRLQAYQKFGDKIYEKGKLVFNYHRAGRFARKSKRVILVEGAMDVLAFEKADIHESIACLGTACTDFQCNLIKQLHVPVTVCYDGDRADKMQLINL